MLPLRAGAGGVSELRVIDFGRVSPLRSQTLWHAVAHGVSVGEPPTLSFCQPDAPYVSIGFHRQLQELDLDFCRAAGLPVYRRMVGGGPVYLDDGQHFFQISVPAAVLPAARPAALRHLLAPAVDAYQAVGIDARLDADGEIAVGDAKICGHAAGQIEDAVVVVGNLITTFDHDRAAGILAAPHAEARAELLALMRRYVHATPADPAAFRSALAASYAGALGLDARSGAPTADEWMVVDELDRRFEDEDWLDGPIRPAQPGWRAKVRAGVWVFGHAASDTRLALGIRGDRIETARLADPALDGRASGLAAELVGLGLDEAVATLRGEGAAGRRLATLLDGVDGRGL